MTYYGAKELAASFRTVRKNTIAIAQDIPEEKYSFTPVPECRNVAQLLMHIALSPKFQYQVHAIERRTTLDGFDFPAMISSLGAEASQPRSKAQIVDVLRLEGETWASWVEGLTEGFLAERVEMPKSAALPSKSRFEMLLSAKEHEMHHRGQLMLMQRLLGIVPHLTREREQRR